jgi:tetratricopeptide (TPR) repeat protein
MQENPAVEGLVLSTIGTTYYGLGLLDRAQDTLHQAVARYEQAPEVASQERLLARNRLCWVTYKLGSFDETLPRQLYAQACKELGRDHEESVYAADTLGTVIMGNGRMVEGLTLLRENVSIQQRVLGPEHPLTIRAILNLADALMSNYAGDLPEHLEEAESLLLQAREVSRHVLGLNHPEGLYFENALGYLEARMGKYQEARAILAPLEERCLRLFGPDHVDVARWQENMALTEEGLGHFDAAAALLRKSHAIRKARVGEGHGLTRRPACYLGRVCLAAGKREDAVHWFRLLLTEGIVRRQADLNFHSQIKAGGRPGPSKDASRTPAARPADINLLGDALQGKGEPEARAALLRELHRTVNWLTWKKDWLQKYILCLHYEAVAQGPKPRKNSADEREDLDTGVDALLLMEAALKEMESYPLTPPRLLEESRARIKRFQQLYGDKTGR